MPIGFLLALLFSARVATFATSFTVAAGLAGRPFKHLGSREQTKHCCFEGDCFASNC